MKKIINYVIVVLITILISIKSVNSINPIETAMITCLKNIDIYEIKENKNTNKTIIELYKSEPDNKRFIKMRIKEERLERLKQEEIENTLRINIVNFSKMFIGNPYVSGGTSLTEGADCSGFVQSIFRNFNIILSRTAPDQSKDGYSVEIDDIKPGDIISYGYNGNVGHSAIYIGDNKIIHSSTPELGIRIDNMDIMPIVSIRRVIN